MNDLEVLVTSLSVVIPVWNGEHTIARALNSVENAASKARECWPNSAEVDVVVSLSGEQGTSRGIVAEWASRNHTPVSFAEALDGGIGAARNAGWRHSSSAYLTFLDQDDELTPERLNPEYLPPSGSLTVGQQSLRGFDDYPLPLGIGALSQPDGALRPGHFYVMSFITKADTFREMDGFDDTFSHGADWDFIIRASQFDVSIRWVSEDFTIRHLDGFNASLDSVRVRAEYFRGIRANIRRQQATPYRKETP